MAVDTSGATQATYTTSGVLNCWVRQPVSNSPYESQGQIIYTEKWLAPYSSARSILDNVANGFSIAEVHTKLTNIIEYDNLKYPNCPTRNYIQGTWTLFSTNVEEKTDGNNALVTFVYQANYGNSVTTLTDDPYGDVWSLNWQSYSVNPFAFCSNEDFKPTDAESSRPSDGAKNPDFKQTAMRQHIQKYINAGNKTWTAESKNNKMVMYAYYDNDTKKNAYLSPAEAKIYEKYLNGKSCVYHYPVLVHQTVKRGKFQQGLEYEDTLGEDLDHFSDDVPEGCPYYFNDNSTYGPVYKWLKVGDDMEQTANKTNTTFTRRETWWGVVDPDANFYGSGTFGHTENGILSGRWEIGKL